MANIIQHFVCSYLTAFGGYYAASLLSLLPERWLREKWEPVTLPVSASRLAPLYAAAGAAFGFFGSGLLLPVLFFLLAQISAVDIARKIIPDPHLLVLALLGLLRILLSGLFRAFLSAGALGFLSLLLAFPALFGKPSPLGLGDVKLFLVLGLFLLPEKALFFFAFAFLLNGLLSLTLLLLGKCKTTDALPMAPAVCVSFLVLYLF